MADKIMSFKNKRATIKSFIYLIGTLLLAFFIEYLMNFNFYGAINVYRSHLDSISLNVSDFSTNNVAFDGKRYIATADDPWIVAEDINCFVGRLEIRYKRLSSSYLNLQIFISNAGEEFSEENSIHTVLLENEGCVYVDINQQVKSLRLDIGDIADDGCILQSITINPSLWRMLCSTVHNMSALRVLIYWLLLVLLMAFLHNPKKTAGFLYQHRWSVGVSLIVFCTLCKLHGSSIGTIPQALGGYNTSTLWGTPRHILSDEYKVFTGRALGQVSSGFQWFSNLFGYDAQNMYLIYGQPVWDFATIFRPFSVGFLFFGAEYGLAFYWSSRIVIGFLVSFEFGRIITKDRKGLSVAYAFLTIFSPVVQWWFAPNETVELFTFGQLALIILYYYIRTSSVKRKCIMMAGLVLSAGTYILTLYPARMVPLFYVFLACAVALLIENREYIKIKKLDIAIWGAGVTVLIISLLHVFSKSSDTIAALMNTVYPGDRIYKGGPIENVVELFRGWTSWIYSFVPIVDPCQESGFFNLYPIGLILSVIILIKQKNKDSWLIALNISNLLLTVYLLFDLPDIIGKITLLERTSRMICEAIGFLNLMLLFRSIILLSGKAYYKKLVFGISIVSIFFSLYGSSGLITNNVEMLVVVVGICFVLLLLSCLDSNSFKKFIAASIAISIIGGVIVHPVNSGLNTIYNFQLVQQIQKINQEDGGSWITDSWVLGEMPTAVGAKTLNVTETYPDVNMWTDLGLEEYEGYWNRYLHVSVIIDSGTYLELVQGDLAMLHVTVDKLREIGVKYIVTAQTLEESDGVKRMVCVNSRNIYKILS